MSLPQFVEEPEEGFSKICFIPSLGLSCFGCCGHHFKDKKTMHAFFDKNKKELRRYLMAGKSHKEFMEREHFVDECGGCYSLIREKINGKYAYVCAVHPERIGRPDIRPGYCEHDYLCKTAAFVNTMNLEDRKQFYKFLKEKKFDSFTYSIINSQENILLEMFMNWKTTSSN